MRTPYLALVLVLALSASPAAAQDDVWEVDLSGAERDLLQGDLRKAEGRLLEILIEHAHPIEEEPPRPEQVLRARVGLWEIDLRRGNYQRVLTGWEDPNTDPDETLGHVPGIDDLEAADRPRDVIVLRARTLSRIGRYQEALADLEPLIEDPSDFEASFLAGELQAEVGRDEDAGKTWQAAVQQAERTRVRDGEALAWLGRCLIELGGRNNIQRASQYLVDSMRVAPDRPEARISRGILRFQVYGEAAGFDGGEEDLKKVLDNNGEVEEALLALYRLRRSNFQKNPALTQDYLERALQLNRNSVPALIEQAVILLDDRRFEDGAAKLDRALEVNPRDKRALAHRAAAAYLMHELRDYEGYRDRALEVDASYTEADRILADHLVALYRFEDAIPYYRGALDADGEDIPALHGLAKALIYNGKGGEAVALLQKAESLQPGFVNPWRRNALAVEQLLEDEYVRVDTDGFSFRLHEQEQGVLSACLVPMHERARAILGQKYGYRPPEDVRVEVFHTWDDFSVRTIGFRGFTALGACFGPFLTLVSPADGDLRRQDFMWAATVWHEYAHVLTLALSNHRVPRWLTEGISVYEERARDPSWERGMQRQLYDAFHSGQITPVRMLNSLFRGPRILFGYYQGGLIVEYIAARHGFDKVLRMLQLYGEDRGTEEIFQEVLGIATGVFDQRLLEFIEKDKLASMKLVPHLDDESVTDLLIRIARDPDDLEARVLLGWAYAHRGNPVDAGSQIREVLQRDEDHGPALLLHAELLRQREAFAEAETAYRRGFSTGAEDFDSRIRFGRLLQARGDLAAAMEQFQRAKGCWPDCTDQSVAPTLLLGAVLEELEMETEAMMELKSFCNRTARAFAPRLRLAEYEQRQGNRKLEAGYLEQALRIDPFVRGLHLRLADAYEALDRQSDAIAALEVALLVPPSLDRAYMADPAAAPADDSEAERLAKAGIHLRLAKLYRGQGDDVRAFRMLDATEELAPGSEPAAQARQLRQDWR